MTALSVIAGIAALGAIQVLGCAIGPRGEMASGARGPDSGVGSFTRGVLDQTTPPLPGDDQIRRMLAERIENERWATGIVVGIVTPQGRRIVSYGTLAKGDPRPLNGDTVFEIGSVTKVLTALLLADMVRQGDVSLDDPVAKYLPTHVSVPQWQGHAIKLVDLATHTSGLPFFPPNLPDIDDPGVLDHPPDYSEKDFLDFLRHYELLHDVGVHWEYSNVDYGLLGYALARRENSTYRETLEKRILMPLGMKSTAFSANPSMRARLCVGHDVDRSALGPTRFPAVLQGAGGLYSTANDLLNLLEAELGLRKTWLDAAMAMMPRTVRPCGDWLENLGAEQALGWWIFGDGENEVLAHEGVTNGFSCSMAFNPRTRVGVVELTNCWTGAGLAIHLLRPSFPLAHRGLPPKPIHEVASSPALFDRLVGKYQAAPYLVYVISRQGDTLKFTAPGNPRVRLRPLGDTKYAVSPNASVTFQLDEAGPARSFVLDLGGGTITAKRLP